MYCLVDVFISVALDKLQKLPQILKVLLHILNTTDKRIEWIPKLVGHRRVHKRQELLFSFGFVVKHLVRYVDNLD